jgi:very-short-patch-repair endonuclease
MERTRYLVRSQCRVIRFTNLDIQAALWEVLESIERACRESATDDKSA